MNVSNLPEVEFVSADKEKVVTYLMDVYTAVTGRTLAKADPIRLFILVIASVVIMLHQQSAFILFMKVLHQ